MAERSLPWEYQTEIDKASQQAQLAQYLQSQVRQPQGKMLSGHYVKSSPMQHLTNALLMYQSGKSQRDAREGRDAALQRYDTDSSTELNSILKQQMPQNMNAGKPQVDDTGEASGASIPAMSEGASLGAEMRGRGSKFAGSQALGKALYDSRQKREEATRSELLKRVDLKSIQSGNLQGGTPKGEFGVTDGVAYRKDETGIKALGQYEQITVPGADGRPQEAQKAPFTGKRDILDKQPKVSTTVNNNQTPEDPYFKELLTKIAGTDHKTVEAGKNAIEELPRIEELKKIHIDSKGQWTGGPAAGPVRFVRDLGAQFGVPIDPNVDLTNSKMQAIMSANVAKAIVSNGRGLTDEDRRALEKSFPTDKITPAQFPAFINMYEKMARNRAESYVGLVGRLRSSRPDLPNSLHAESVPTSSGPVPETPQQQVSPNITMPEFMKERAKLQAELDTLLKLKK